MPARRHSLKPIAKLLAISTLVLSACAAPAAVPPTAAPTQPATGTAVPPTPVPPTAAATAQITPAIRGPVPATYATLDGPTGIVFDVDGNLYVSECGSSPNILKVDRTGLLTVFAGSGDGGFSGDGGPALSAQLNCPNGLAFDRDGNLYVADQNNNRIRRIDRGGVINTVAGSGPADTGDFGGDGGPATAALLKSPSDIAFDTGGNLYIADPGNNRVRKVDRQGIITTIAGSGDFVGFGGDGGPATAARFSTAGCVCGGIEMGVAIDADGNLYVNDMGNYRIRKVDTHGMITTIAGNDRAGLSGDGGLANAASLLSASFLAIDDQGNLYFSERPAAGIDIQRVRRVGNNGIITTVAGRGERGFSGDGGPATEAALFGPGGLALDPAGNLYFVDGGNARVRKVDQNGIITTVVGGRP